GGLAAARGPEKTDEFAVSDRKIDGVDRDDAGITLGELLELEACHRRTDPVLSPRVDTRRGDELTVRRGESSMRSRLPSLPPFANHVGSNNCSAISSAHAGARRFHQRVAAFGPPAESRARS